MAIPRIATIGISGLNAAKAGIATAGHNISNANTEGYSRQRIVTESESPQGTYHGSNILGSGARLARVERINDAYLDKQIRNSFTDVSHFEEKDLALKQLEEIFNESDGEGLNRLVAKFFNDFRKLSQEPENPALRESVRESSIAMTQDFHRLAAELKSVREHIDARIESSTQEVNSLLQEIAHLNQTIRTHENSGAAPNGLLDQRELALKKLGSYLNISSHTDKSGNLNVDLKGGGPLLSSVFPSQLSVERTDQDQYGKSANSLDVFSSGSTPVQITHTIKGGRLGALIEVRDQILSRVTDQLDLLAFHLIDAVNEAHTQGYSLDGVTGICYFQPLDQPERASEFIQVSQDVVESARNIATAAVPGAPGDNRIALAITHIQSSKIMDQRRVGLEDWYNSMVSQVGIASGQNQFVLHQEKDVLTQLNKMREHVSGVSIDEETAQLMQFQHAFDASAKVVQIADEMLKTIISMK